MTRRTMTIPLYFSACGHQEPVLVDPAEHHPVDAKGRRLPYYTCPKCGALEADDSLRVDLAEPDRE